MESITALKIKSPKREGRKQPRYLWAAWGGLSKLLSFLFSDSSNSFDGLSTALLLVGLFVELLAVWAVSTSLIALAFTGFGNFSDFASWSFKEDAFSRTSEDFGLGGAMRFGTSRVSSFTNVNSVEDNYSTTH